MQCLLIAFFFSSVYFGSYQFMRIQYRSIKRVSLKLELMFIFGLDNPNLQAVKQILTDFRGINFIHMN